MGLDPLKSNLLVSYGCTHVTACGWLLLASFTCMAGDCFLAGGWLTIECYLNSLPRDCSTSSRLACVVVINIHIYSHAKYTHLCLGLLKDSSNYGNRLKTPQSWSCNFPHILDVVSIDPGTSDVKRLVICHLHSQHTVVTQKQYNRNKFFHWKRGGMGNT